MKKRFRKLLMILSVFLLAVIVIGIIYYKFISYQPSPILIATQRGNAEEVEKILSEHPDLVKANHFTTHGDRRTLLHIAVACGRCELIPILIKYGADIHAKDRMGWEPIFESTMRGLEFHPECLNLLIQNGATVNVTDIKGRSPILLAGHTLVKFKALIQAGADVNLADNNGVTPLLSVVSEFTGTQEELEIIRLLLNSGASIHVQNKEGKNLLDIAKSKNNQELNKFLNINEKETSKADDASKEEPAS